MTENFAPASNKDVGASLMSGSRPLDPKIAAEWLAEWKPIDVDDVPGAYVSEYGFGVCVPAPDHLPGFVPVGEPCPRTGTVCDGCVECLGSQLAVPTVEELESMYAATPQEENGWMDEEQNAVDAAERTGPIAWGDVGARIKPGTGVARDLLQDGQVIAVVGEEGQGKSTLARQWACQLAMGEKVGGLFEVEGPVSPILIVDVEQSEEDEIILVDEARARGLKTDGIFWQDAQGRAFDTPADQKWLRAIVRKMRPPVIIFDTGTEAVTKPREDESVKPFFVFLYSLLKNDGVRDIILLAQPRKQMQTEKPQGRRFDDLFGSRVWKGRSSAVLYLTEDEITVWKQRGQYIRRRFGTQVLRYERSDDTPSLILPPKTVAESDADRETAIMAVITDEPAQWSKSALLEKKLDISHRDWTEWAAVIDRLVACNLIVQVGQYKRLSPGIQV